MTRRARSACFAGIVFVAFSAWADESFVGKVVGVADGDTITVLVDRQPHKIRLHGIDAPERDQPYATKAKQLASDLVFGQVVRVDVVDIDRYGRHVGIVHLGDGRILNHELVKAGLAWWYEEYAPNDTTLRRFEEDARRGRLGLWDDENPTPPWRHRATKRPKPKQSGDEAEGQRPSLWRMLFGTRASDAAPPDAGQNGMVFVTSTGTKYHGSTCRYARNAKTISLDHAAAGGYQACKVCGGK
jgi:micrococcal nuclease